MTEESKALVKADDARFVDDILKRAMETRIVTPEDYSMENAVKSAYLEFYEKGYFQSCSQNSIMNACMDMVVQGLNPVKEQCYFIKFGNILKCMRSYMGSIAVAKRFDPNVEKINAEVIYKGDEVDYDIEHGVKKNIKHRQSLSNVKNDAIIGVYAVAIDKVGNEIESDLMLWEEILQSWSRSTKKGEYQPVKSNGKLNEKSDHYKHPARFCRRTIINRLCKTLISATDDKELLRAIRKTDEDAPMIEIIQNDVEEKANRKVIDFEPKKDPAPDQTAEPVPMATMTQAETITKLSAELNQNEKMMANICGYFEADIKKISELTEDQATEYIEILQEEIKSNESNPGW